MNQAQESRSCGGFSAEERTHVNRAVREVADALQAARASVGIGRISEDEAMTRAGMMLASRIDLVSA